ncbi:ankyrin repeat protein, partial [Trifolium medium]|nr:ankyrin repeat protein [Trifolium medium]
MLLGQQETNLSAVNRSGETAVDTAEKTGNQDIKTILLEHGVQSAKSIKP